MLIQKKKILRLSVLAAIAVMFLLGGSSSSFAQHKKYSAKDMPSGVVESFTKLYPTSQITGYDIEKEDGNTFYEIQSKEGSMNRDAQYTSDGKLVSVEESMNLSDLPAEVTAAINSKYPKAKITKAERITKGSETNFEVLIKSKKKKIELLINSKGDILSTE